MQQGSSKPSCQVSSRLPEEAGTTRPGVFLVLAASACLLAIALVFTAASITPPGKVIPEDPLEARFLLSLLSDWHSSNRSDLNLDGETNHEDVFLASYWWYQIVPQETPLPSVSLTPTQTPQSGPTDTPTSTATKGEPPSPTPSSTMILKATDSVRVKSATADAYIALIQSASNFGTEMEIRAQWHSEVEDEEVALLRFDLTDVVPNTEIFGAYLCLILTGTQESGEAVVTVHHVEEPWNEMEVTWTTQPVFASEVIAGLTVGPTTELEIFLDVTPLVKDWVANPESNYGMALQIQPTKNGGSMRVFGSRESNAPPRLNLAYRIPGPEIIELIEPSPTPIPPYSEEIPSVSEVGYVRWEGRDSYDTAYAAPEDLVLSFDYTLPLIECYLLSFNLPTLPEGNEIYQASLEVYLQDGENPSPVHIQARMMDVEWNTDTATWGSVLGAYNSETDAPRGVAWVGLETGWVSMDVTRLLHRWMRSPDRNFGFHLSGEEGDDGPWFRVFAGPNSANAPRLILRYGPEIPSSKNQESGKTLPSYGAHCPAGGATLGLPPPARHNWSTIESATAVSGTVHNPHVTHTDWPSSHNGHDLVFEISYNSSIQWALGSANPNNIEIEWENQCIPLWSWPKHGEKITVFGPLIYDCGHGPKTEIHPPRGMVTFRENIAADMSPHGGVGVALANRADVLFSNRRTKAYCGGYCEVLPPGSPTGIPVYPSYVPLNDRDYEFDLYPPKNSDEGAQLVAWMVHHSHNWGQNVKPILTLHDQASTPYVHVKIPYKSNYGSVSGKMHTASSVYCAWTKTKDPDLRAFKVSLEGVDIYDKTEGLFKGDGEFYMWLNIQDQWFNLRHYIPALSDADDKYYSVDKPLDTHIIVPNTSSGKIEVRAGGYESDYYDDLMGWDWPWPAYLAALAIYDDNDRIQTFHKDFKQTDGFSAGTTATYKAQGDNDGKYGLKLTVIEENAPFQARFIKAGIAGETIDIHDGCISEEYENSQKIGFGLKDQVSDAEVRASYDEDALYVCISDIDRAGNVNDLLDGREVVVYLDPGAPSQPKVGSNWVGRDDDLRIAFHASPATGVVAYHFDPTKGWYAKPVAAGLVTADLDYGFYTVDVEFRIDKSLIPNGPWSQTVSEKSLLQKGIGVLFAVEKPSESRSGAWPNAGWSMGPHEWARMWFDLACPIHFWASRIGAKASNTKVAGGAPVTIGGQSYEIAPAGDVVTVKLKYEVGFEHPRCYLVGGKLEANVPAEFKTLSWSPTAFSTYQNGKLSWDLPSAATGGEFTYTIQQTKQCDIGASPSNPCPPDTDNYAGGTLTTSFQSSNVPSLSQTAFVAVGDCFCARGIPDTRQWPPGWPLGKFPPWVHILYPEFFGGPMGLNINIRNENFFDREIIVQAMEVPMGVSSSHPGANTMLDFSAAPEHLYNLPADSEIGVNLQMQLPGTQKAAKSLIGNGTGGAIAVQIFDPDRGEPQVSVHQVVPYLPMTAGSDNVYPVNIWRTMLEPGDISIQGWAYEEGWEIVADPKVIPVTYTHSEEGPPTVNIHIQPPAGELLGSGMPIDIVAWSDTGEVVGTQRILDLPPVQFSAEQPPFAHGDLVLEPPNPEVGQEAVLCAILRNRSETPRTVEVEFRQSDALSTAGLFYDFFLDTVEVPAGGIERICSDPFLWEGNRSFQALIRQDGYRDQVIERNVGLVAAGPVQETGCVVIGEGIGADLYDQTVFDATPVRFQAAGGGDAVTTFHVYDCSGNEVRDVFVPISDPAGGHVYMEFQDEICDGSAPIHAEVVLSTGSSCTLHALDEGGSVVDTATATVPDSTEVLVLSHEEGIRRILVEGAEVCIQQVCWVCEERFPSPGPYVVSLEVRNPLETAEEITLAKTLVGLNGWEVDMLDGVGLEGGDAAEIEIILLPPALGGIRNLVCGRRELSEDLGVRFRRPVDRGCVDPCIQVKPGCYCPTYGFTECSHRIC